MVKRSGTTGLASVNPSAPAGAREGTRKTIARALLALLPERRFFYRSFSGGSAALHHRLRAYEPPAQSDQSICCRHLHRVSSIAIAIPIAIAIWIKIMIMIKIKNNPQPTTYNPLLGGITEVTFPPFGAGYAELG